MKTSAKAALAAFLLAVAVPQNVEGVPGSVATGHLNFMPSTQRSYLIFAHPVTSSHLPPEIFNNYAFGVLPPPSLGDQRNTLNFLLHQYHTATSREQQQAYVQQMFPLVLDQMRKEGAHSRTLEAYLDIQLSELSPFDPTSANLRDLQERLGGIRNHNFMFRQSSEAIAQIRETLGPHPPKRGTNQEREQKIAIEEIAGEFERRLGYIPFESNQYQTVERTWEGYIVHDLVEQRGYHYPYNLSLEITLITNEAGEHIFEEDEQGVLVPAVYFLNDVKDQREMYASIASRLDKNDTEKHDKNEDVIEKQGKNEYATPSEEIGSSEEFNEAYPDPIGCGGSAKGVGFVLLPLAVRRKKEDLSKE